MAILVVAKGAPVPKGRPRIGKSKAGFAIAFTPAKTRKYEDFVRFCASEVMKDRLPITSQPILAHVRAYLPPPQSWSNKRKQEAYSGLIRPTKKPDVDNYLKAALDALNGICFGDDSQIVSLSVIKKYSDNPRLEIEINAIENVKAAP
jgi:Holliday junction resolvase RusA-like endonuclease